MIPKLSVVPREPPVVRVADSGNTPLLRGLYVPPRQQGPTDDPVARAPVREQQRPLAQPADQVPPRVTTVATGDNTVPRGATASAEARVLAESIRTGHPAIPPAELMRRIGDLTGVAPVKRDSAQTAATVQDLERMRADGTILGFQRQGSGFEIYRRVDTETFARDVRRRLEDRNITTGLPEDARRNILSMLPALGGMEPELRAQSRHVEADLRGPARTPAERVVGNLRLQGWAITQLAPTDAARARGRVADYPEPVNFMVPPNYQTRPDGTADLNLHVHGWTQGATVQNALFGRFNNFATITNPYRGITVIPESPDRDGGHHFELKALVEWHGMGRNRRAVSSNGLTTFMNQVVGRLQSAGALTVAPGRDPVSAVRNLSLTGHSGAYNPMGAWLNTSNPYWSRLRGVGLFDATYGRIETFASIGNRLNREGGFFMAVGVQDHDTGNNIPGLATGIGPSVSVQVMSPGQTPLISGNVYIGNETARRDEDYTSVQHYAVQRRHMTHFFGALNARLR
ncbi:MAG: hypothetical protein ACAI38_15840 [Myxococcota bacterium]